MIHHALVLQVVFADIGLVVAEGLTAGVELAEIAGTGIQRVASGIDNFRVGQYRMDKTHQWKIVGHLVDKMRCAFHPVHAGHIQVALAQPVKMAWLQLRQHRRVAHAICTVAIK